jgi:cardiolipin synthase
MFHCKVLMVDGLLVSVGWTNSTIARSGSTTKSSGPELRATAERNLRRRLEALEGLIAGAVHTRPLREKALERLSTLFGSQP